MKIVKSAQSIKIVKKISFINANIILSKVKKLSRMSKLYLTHLLCLPFFSSRIAVVCLHKNLLLSALKRFNAFEGGRIQCLCSTYSTMVKAPPCMLQPFQHTDFSQMSRYWKCSKFCTDFCSVLENYSDKCLCIQEILTKQTLTSWPADKLYVWTYKAWSSESVQLLGNH